METGSSAAALCIRDDRGQAGGSASRPNVLDGLFDDDTQPDIKKMKSALSHLSDQLESQRHGINTAIEVATQAARAAALAAEGLNQLMSSRERSAQPDPRPPPGLSTATVTLSPTQPMEKVSPAKIVAARERDRIRRHLAKTSREYEKHLRKFFAMQNLEKKLSSEVAAMSESFGHYPPGTKPFKMPYDLSEMDTCLPECEEADLHITCVINHGTGVERSPEAARNVNECPASYGRARAAPHCPGLGGPVGHGAKAPPSHRVCARLPFAPTCS